MTLVKQAVSYQIESSRYRPRNTPKITTYEHGSTARRIHPLALNACARPPAVLRAHRLLEDYSPFVIPNEQHHVMEGHLGNVKCVEFLGDQGNRLVSGSRSVRRTRGAAARNRGANAAHRKPTFVWSGRRSDNTVRVWDIDSAQCVATLRGHSSRVWDLAPNRNGDVVASASGDGSVRVRAASVTLGGCERTWGLSRGPCTPRARLDSTSCGTCAPCAARPSRRSTCSLATSTASTTTRTRY